MSLLGPDGKPAVMNGPQLVGSKKRLEDMPLLSQEEIDNFVEAARHILSTGMPLEVPAALPTGLMVRTAATLVSLSSPQEVGEE